MTWTDWNWINVFCMFFSTFVAITCFKDERNWAGHLNMFAAVLNGWIVAARLGF